MHLPDDIQDYLNGRPTLSDRQKAALRQLAADCQDAPTTPDALAARHVRRLIKSGWRFGSNEALRHAQDGETPDCPR